MPRTRLAPRLLALALIAAMLVAACSGDDGEDASESTVTTKAELAVQQGGTLRYAADQEPTGFNINTSKDNGTSVQNVIETVYPAAFHAHPDFTVQQDRDFITSAELTESDPQTIVYEVDKAAAWSDGTPIGAPDFVFLWQNLNGSSPDIDAASTTGYEDVESITGSDGDKTVTVVFSRRFADWKSLFGNILPSHFVKAQEGGWNTGLDAGMPLSGGPFIVKSYERGKALTLVRNESYWGRKAKLDSIVFRFLPESTTQPAALENDEVDLIYPQPQLDQVQQIRAMRQIKSEINFGLSFEHLTLNTAQEFLADVKVRQALAKAIDRKEVVARTVAQFDPKAEPLHNRIWLTGQPQYEVHGKEYQEVDVAGAGTLLEAAGFTKGADGIYQRAGKKLSLRLSTTAGNSLREQQGVLIQAQVRKAGIDIRIDNSPSDVLFGDRLPKGNFDIANFAWVGTPFAASSNKALYTTGSDSNYGKFSDPRVDALFEKVTGELDEDTLADQLNRIDELLWEGMASIPLYQKPTFLAYRATFVNIGDNATAEGPFWNANTWALKQ